MKMREWEQKLLELREGAGKRFFRVTELANMSTTNPKYIGGELARLVEAGVLVRYAHGVYGLPGARDASELASTIDSSAYITGTDALYHHGHTTQAVVAKTCFTNRRHNRSRVRRTPFARVQSPRRRQICPACTGVA
jgi:predicted transcriptional regulator of viral defense system